MPSEKAIESQSAIASMIAAGLSVFDGDKTITGGVRVSQSAIGPIVESPFEVAINADGWSALVSGEGQQVIEFSARAPHDMASAIIAHYKARGLI